MVKFHEPLDTGFKIKIVFFEILKPINRSVLIVTEKCDSETDKLGPKFLAQQQLKMTPIFDIDAIQGTNEQSNCSCNRTNDIC